MTAVHTLSSIVLPPQISVERDLPRQAAPQSAQHADWQQYDRRTLVYDVVFLADIGLVRLYLPRLLNLEHLLKGCTYGIDGVPVRPTRHKVYRRFETFDFRSPNKHPQVFALSIDAADSFQVPINRGDTDSFRNRRVIYTMLKDERLEWIHDWLLFHHRVHGANAVLIANNGSTSYSSEQLLKTITAVPGYEAAALISVPLPWGPKGTSPGVDDGKYLQTSLLNLARDRFLTRAYAVLNADVDELVLSRKGQSVFDRAQRWGLITFPGEWRYPAQIMPDVRHADHRYLDPNGRPCATKYCFRPASILGGMCLSVHGPERLHRNLFLDRRNFLLLHCRNISTSWKYNRAKVTRPGLKLDPPAAAALDSVFPSHQMGG